MLEKRSSTTHKELQSLVRLLSFAAKVVYPGQHFSDDSMTDLHWSKPIGDDLLWWEKFLPRWNIVTLLRQHRQCFSLWTDASGFRGTRGYFLPGHCTLHEFRENVPICNKFCSSSEVTGFSSSEAALLSLAKVFSYCFSTRQRAKRINFKEMTVILQALTRWIETFNGSHLHIFGDNFVDNFVVIHGLQKNSIKER